MVSARPVQKSSSCGNVILIGRDEGQGRGSRDFSKLMHYLERRVGFPTFVVGDQSAER